MEDNKTALLASYGASCDPLTVYGCEGSYINTSCGRLLDWISGQASCPLGHGHAEVVEVIVAHAATLIHTYSGTLSQPLLRFAESLINVLPSGLDCAFFPSTGGEANEAAIRLAKIFTGKFEIVSLGGAWHGMTSQAQATQYICGRGGHGPLQPGCFMLPQPNARKSGFRDKNGLYDWQAELDYGWDLIDQSCTGSLAACIVECVQGDAGVLALPHGYLKALKEHCRQRGMLLIIDEVQTCFGRTGKLFAFEHESVVPDILTLGKGVGHGLPLSAVVMSADINRICKDRSFTFYVSHMNDPLPLAVADKVLEIILRDGLVEKSRQLGEYLLHRLQNLCHFPEVVEIRGRGLMIGIELSTETLGRQVVQKLTASGLWLAMHAHRYAPCALRICPPLNSTIEEIQEGCSILERVFASILDSKQDVRPGCPFSQDSQDSERGSESSGLNFVERYSSGP